MQLDGIGIVAVLPMSDVSNKPLVGGSDWSAAYIGQRLTCEQVTLLTAPVMACFLVTTNCPCAHNNSAIRSIVLVLKSVNSDALELSD